MRQRTAALYGKVQENYFGNLHLSPLKIHLSFSYTGTGGSSAASGGALRQDNPVSQLLSLIIQSVGVSLTEVQDVVFRLGYFERSNAFLSWPQLGRELQWHYVGQAVKQFYVLVFGLDVIGNPIGLALNISRGVEQLFYEPYQGIIQGPDEFVEGLSLGVRSLFGHTVAGMAGAASKITGTLGKGLAYLTFDEEYQKKRRETMLRRSTDLRENLAQGGKGLFMGVVEGISGVVLRPIEGAKQQGVGGFFSGAVKGVVGLVRGGSVHRLLFFLLPPNYPIIDVLISECIRSECAGDPPDVCRRRFRQRISGCHEEVSNLGPGRCVIVAREWHEPHVRSAHFSLRGHSERQYEPWAR